MFTRTRNICAILLTILWASACGGGGGGGGAAPPPPAPPPPDTGGITRTGVAVAVGPITGFGSVIVNGVHYDTSSATFTKDGVASSQAEMSVGEFVVVTGTIDDDNTNAVATTVEYEDLVEGPISSVSGNTFVALGQTVIMSPGSTSIDDSCPDPLAVDVLVEVSGTFIPPNGDIDASRVECKAALLEFEVKGKATGVTGTTFQINALIVNYDGIVPRNFAGGTIGEGDPVEVKGTNFDIPTLTLTATDVEFKGPRFGDNEGDHVEAEGFIADWDSATQFTVNTIPVTTDDNTNYEPAGMGASNLGPNLKVEVEGDYNDQNILLATKIQFKQATNIRVAGLVGADNIDRPLSRYILGIEITSDPDMTRFEDKTDVRQTPLLIEHIVAGNYVAVRGQEFPADSGIVDAVILEREDVPGVPGEETELRGFVNMDGDNNRPSLTILGVDISTDGTTEYFDDRGDNTDPPPSMAPDAFWAEVAKAEDGALVLVDAKGRETGDTAMFADELELED